MAGSVLGMAQIVELAADGGPYAVAIASLYSAGLAQVRVRSMNPGSRSSTRVQGQAPDATTRPTPGDGRVLDDVEAGGVKARGR
jgi:hypothetical protein